MALDPHMKEAGYGVFVKSRKATKALMSVFGENIVKQVWAQKSDLKHFDEDGWAEPGGGFALWANKVIVQLSNGRLVTMWSTEDASFTPTNLKDIEMEDDDLLRRNP